MAVPAVASVGSPLTGGTRASSAVPVPSGVVSGSLVLVYLYLEDTGAASVPTGFAEITGFTPAPQTTSPVSRQRVFWKRATGADTGTYTFTHTSTWTSGVAIRTTGAVASGTPFEVLASGQSTTYGTLTPTVSGSTAGADRLLVYGATVRPNTTFNPPSGFTEVSDAGDEVMVAAKGQPAAGATGPLTSSTTASGFATTATLIGLVPATVSTDTTAPSAPSNLVATATGPSTVLLTWDAATDNVGVTGYVITRNGSTVTTVTGTTFGDSGLTAATAYTYTVKAQDAAGNLSAVSNSASATTAAAVAPGLSVTATPESSNIPPRVRLNVVDTRAVPATMATVLRINPDGTTTPVATTDGGPLALALSGSSRVGLLYDYEAPLGVPVSYTTAEVPGSISGAVTVDSESVWLVHPGLPAISMPIELRAGSLDEETWDVQQGVFWPMGRQYPIVHTDGRRKAAAGSVTVQISSVVELRTLAALTADASTLLLNIPAHLNFGVDSRYIAVGAVQVRRPSNIGSDPLRAVQLPFQTVERPISGTQAERTLTSLTVYPTLQTLSDAYDSLADLAVGP